MLKVHERVGRPEALTQLAPRHDFSRALNEHPQDLERLRLDRDLDPAFSQLSGGEIHFEDAEARDRKIRDCLCHLVFQLISGRRWHLTSADKPIVSSGLADYLSFPFNPSPDD